MSSYLISVFAGFTVECVILLAQKNKQSTVKYKRLILIITLFFLLAQITNVFSNITINHTTPTKTINFKIQNNSFNLTVNSK